MTEIEVIEVDNSTTHQEEICKVFKKQINIPQFSSPSYINGTLTM